MSKDKNSYFTIKVINNFYFSLILYLYTNYSQHFVIAVRGYNLYYIYICMYFPILYC